MKFKRPWIAFFSQTGSDLATVSTFFKTLPDVIVTNRTTETGFTPWLIVQKNKNPNLLQKIPNKPTVEDYEKILSKYEDPLITLHGYLRILPADICSKYEIFNLHPGLITKYPELKGKDPQYRAIEGKYKTGGCVIHKVIPEVDEGEILAWDEIDIENEIPDRVYTKLHSLGSVLWCNFLKQYVE